jgi:hypothetical protein
MNDQEMEGVTRELQRELTNILINSSLYLDMSQTDRQKLLHDLVLSYFNLLPNVDQSIPSQGDANRNDDLNLEVLSISFEK